jgi:hypothetical protein
VPAVVKGSIMTDFIGQFLSEVREWPKFIEAAKSDDKLLRHYETMEVGLRTFAVCHDPHVIEAFDQIIDVIKRRDVPLRARLFEVSRLASVVRDHGRSVQ